MAADVEVLNGYFSTVADCATAVSADGVRRPKGKEKEEAVSHANARKVSIRVPPLKTLSSPASRSRFLSLV